MSARPSKWFVFAQLVGQRWRFLEPDAFDLEHGLWRANRTPPPWMAAR